MDFAGSSQFYQDAADIDGNGDLDIFTSGPHPSADGGAIMRNNGTGRFTSRTYIGNGPDGVAAGVLRDLNGDRKPDLLFNNANTSSQYDFFTSMNNGNGTFGPVTRWVVRSAGWGAIDAFDIDNDGDLDVIDWRRWVRPAFLTADSSSRSTMVTELSDAVRIRSASTATKQGRGW